MNESPLFRTAFVTGATGLLGNNLVRTLVEKGRHVRALTRSLAKAQKQFHPLPVELIEGDMTNVSQFEEHLHGMDVVFHTAAYFRDSYKGGTHREQLHRTNVAGTAALLASSYAAGVRRFVHTSSIATLQSAPGQSADETMLRKEQEADDYGRSKILADREVMAFLASHPDFWAAFILPGWMHGPGDLGPTSAGQTVLDFLNRKLPGIPPAGFSVVDARDVAEAMIRAAEYGKRGERYIVAGQPMSMAEVLACLERVTGIQAPRRKLPLAMLYGIAGLNELQARFTGKPALLSWATVRFMERERERNIFDHRKSERELKIRFRSIEQTFRDEIAWFRTNGFVTDAN